MAPVPNVLRVSILVLALAPAAVAPAADWPAWRGVDTLGVSPEDDLPETWTKDAGVDFEVEVPGWGNSSPVIVGGRVYLTSQTDDDALWVHALGAKDGEKLWSKRVGEGALRSHELHNMASPSVVAEEDRLWALFGTGLLVAMDEAGDVIWKRDLTEKHGKYEILWGMASSPVLLGERLFVVCMHAGPSYVLAIDKESGEDLWKTERKLECVGEATDSYSTPVIARLGDRTELIVAGADHVNAYDPATGEELWISSGLKIEHKYGRSIASPTFGAGYVVAPSSNFGNLGRTIALRAGGEGDVSEKRAWTFDKASPDCPTPVVYDGRVYFVRDDGIGACVDLDTGEELWRKRLFRGDVKASPVAGDGKVYFVSKAGECLVVRAGDEGEELSRQDLGEAVIATPALAMGRVWIRSQRALRAIGGAED